MGNCASCSNFVDASGVTLHDSQIQTPITETNSHVNDLSDSLATKHISQAQEPVQDRAMENVPTTVDNSPSDRLKRVSKFDPQEEEITDEEGEKIVESSKNDCLLIKENFDIDTYLDNTSLRNAILRLKKNYYSFKHAGVKRALEYRKRVAADIIEQGVAIILFDIIVKTFKNGWLTEDNTVDIVKHAPFNNAFVVCFNYSDASSELSVVICQHSEFLKSVTSFLQQSYTRFHELEERLHSSEESLLRSALGLVHNCAHVDQNREYLRKLGLPTLLLKYMNNAKEDKQRLCAVLGLANILTEEESKTLQADPRGVKFMIRRLGMAVEDPQLRSMGWSAKELAEGVRGLSSNDGNKQMLVTEGVLPILNKMLQLDSIPAVYSAVSALHALSFAKNNKEKIIEEEGLVDKLNDLQVASAHEKTQRAAKHTLWNLRDELCDSTTYNDIGTSFNSIEHVKSSGAAHIMISYNWVHQATLLHVRDNLKRCGYVTWMDVDNMEGSTLEAMANAVEKAEALLICMSQQYKDSQFCRMEFEYAFKCKKVLVPLVMQPGYKPDGWLGLVIGNSLYHDFSGKYSFESRMEGVLKALGDRGKGKTKPTDVIDAGHVTEHFIVPQKQTVYASPPTHYHTPQPSKLNEISKWSNEEVKTWLKNNDLNQKTRLLKITGRHIVFLWELKSEAPEYFYKLLSTEYKLQTVDDLMTFTSALKHLFT